MIKKIILILILNTQIPTARASSRCTELFQKPFSAIEIESSQDLSHEVAAQVETQLTKKGMTGPQKRGYAILIGSMVGSAALTSYMGSQLNSHLQFLSVFVAQVSTLGVYVFGAPIWEPLSSKFRQLAFGVRKDSSMSGLDQDPQLEAIWLRTQEIYSLNAQMSRNVVSQFIISVKQNFYEAHRAIENDKPDFAADQVAEAAFRLHLLFKDIQPDDISVAAAVTSAFTHHVVINQNFVDLVWARLRLLDPHVDSIESQNFYRTALEAWLKISIAPH